MCFQLIYHIPEVPLGVCVVPEEGPIEEYAPIVDDAIVLLLLSDIVLWVEDLEGGFAVDSMVTGWADEDGIKVCLTVVTCPPPPGPVVVTKKGVEYLFWWFYQFLNAQLTWLNNLNY